MKNKTENNVQKNAKHSADMDFYKKTVKDIFKDLETGLKGLSDSDAKARLDKYGPNTIEEKHKISPWKIFLEQFNSPIVWILIGAVIISVIVGYREFLKEGGSLIKHMIDGIVIFVILILNAVIGFIQEYNAEKAIEALKKMASLKAIVIRDGKEQHIDAINLVPGDIVVLETGEKIPADARLIEIANLQTQEAPLTGESLPVTKVLDVFDKEKVVGDRKNMVFSGTVITDGRGKAVVTGTGMSTQIGKIAHMIQTTTVELTPLQKQLKNLGKWLGILTLIVCFAVFLAGLIKGKPILEFLIVAISLAVAAIPEGLPAVVTIALAIGVKKMVRKNALIRKLPSVETLGSTTVICTDKTGTLTHNEMTVKKIFVDEEVIDVSGSGYEPKGTFSAHTKSLALLLRIGTLNNDSQLEEKDGKHSVIGDPTEGALVVSAAKAGLDKTLLENKHKRIDEIGFNSERKRMTTVHKINGKDYAFVKGAPDMMLSLCRQIEVNGKIRKITPKDKKKVLEKNDLFASEALRVLGFAYKPLKKGDKKKNYEKDLIFVGLQGMIDPPREEVKDAIARCEEAGIKVIMITGDFIGTAKAIAKELNIPGKAITGDELKKLDLHGHVEDIGVYARVNPEDKLKIVEALKKKGHVVAMTGDGVNDAPALKKADIGIAMGISGTDVAKEASDMMLLDDNFSSIVSAVEEGRSIYDNIRKFVNYLLSSNIGEVLVVFVAIMIGLPLPLIAVQILWMNLVTDGLPALALGVDPSSKGIMKRPPRKPKSTIMKGLTLQIIVMGVLIAAATLITFHKGLELDTLAGNDLENPPIARTMAFTTLVFLEIARVQMIRMRYKVKTLSNKWLWMALASSILLQMFVVYGSSIHEIIGSAFETTPLMLSQIGYILAVVAGAFAAGTIITRIIDKITHTVD
ncbi:calcium-translocating P-type ATPase, SERCA-type [Thermoproteota archaeon]